MAFISMLTDEAAAFTVRLKSKVIGCLENEVFKILWEQPVCNSLYLMKWKTGMSFLESLEQEGACETSEKLKSSFREWYVNQKTYAKELSDRTRNGYYHNLLTCLEDKDFTGIIMCNMDISIKREEYAGPLQLVRLFSYQIPFLKLENVVFSEKIGDVSNACLYGFMTSKEKERNRYVDGTEKFQMQIKQLGAGLENSGFKNPFLTAELALYHLFGREAQTESSLQMYGMYNRVESAVGGLYTYRFTVENSTELYFTEGILEKVTIEQAVVGCEIKNGRLYLDLNCTGRMIFRNVSEGFDAFGYGYRIWKNEQEIKILDGWLKYQGMHLELVLAEKESAIKIKYQDIRLTEQKELLMKDAVYAQLPHEPLEFFCHQSFARPEDGGFCQIDTPVKQEALPKEAVWYGLVMPVSLFHGIILQIMFVFSDKTSFSAYGKLIFGKNGSDISISSLMSLEVKSILLYQEKGQPVRLMLKGLKVSLFGLKLPEGSVNAALLPDEKGQMCWYGIYEK